MRIEVLRAWPRRAESVHVELATGASVGDALKAVGINPEGVPLAVFGEPASETTVLVEGDRVELLRPLQVDPKDARRRRAQVQRRVR